MSKTNAKTNDTSTNNDGGGSGQDSDSSSSNTTSSFSKMEKSRTLKVVNRQPSQRINATNSKNQGTEKSSIVMVTEHGKRQLERKQKEQLELDKKYKQLLESASDGSSSGTTTSTSTQMVTPKSPVVPEFTEPESILMTPKNVDVVDDIRGEWTSKLDFMMSCVGYAVGLGNLWRFPYLCYKNGGGSFLIPYFICVMVSGIPVFLLETTLGQMLGQGVISIWNICPIMKGVGYSTVVIAFWMDAYYIIVVTWALYYTAMSFDHDVPWRFCNQTWNTPMCKTRDSMIDTCKLQLGNKTEHFLADEDNMLTPEMHKCMAAINHTDAVIEFWEHKVLTQSGSIEVTGRLHLPLAFCLMIIWVACYLTVYKGVKWTGKIIYFTAVFPYLCMSILMILGFTLDGAWLGLKYYLTPNFEKLLDANVWNDAATQVYYSYGLGLGSWIGMSSYNKFHNNVLKDTIIISIINCTTALVSGAIVFAVIGFMAKQSNQRIEDTPLNGAGLTFIAYPAATLRLPFAPFWAIMFFCMLIVLGLGTQFVQLESSFTAIIDEFPDILRPRRKAYIIFIISLKALIGLIFVTESGIYWFELFNYYAASGFALLFLIFFEVVIVFWFYGSQKYMEKLEFMLNRKVSYYWVVCLKYITPLTCVAIFIFSLVQYQPLMYQQYHYPTWGIMFGWFLALSSMILVPIYAAFRLLTAKGTLKERWIHVTRAHHREIDNIILQRSHKNRLN